MRYQVNFGRVGAASSRPARRSGGRFRLAFMGDFSGRANGGTLETGDALAARKPIKVDVDNLDDVVERMGIELHLPVGADGGIVEVAIGSIDDFHPDELYDNLEIFEEMSGLRQRLSSSSTFAGAAQEVQSWLGELPEAAGAARREGPARGASVPADAKLSDFAQLVGRPTARPEAETTVDELLRQVVGPHVVPEPDPRQDAMVAAVDAALTGTMRAVLHHPDFQAMEALWMSVDFLVRRLETGQGLEIVLYDVTAEELAADLSATDSLEDTGLYRLLVEQPALDAHQGALSAIIGYYTFERTPPHADLLGRVARIAGAAGAPFLASVGADSLKQKFDDLHPLVQDAWTALQGLPESAYLGLAVPRFMLRMPYGRRTEPVDPFDFEEFDPRTGLRGMLWANPSVLGGLLLGATFTQQGERMAPGGVMSVGEMPYFFYTDDDGDQTALPCTERLVSERVAANATAQHLMPVLSIQGRPEVRLGSFVSVAGSSLAGFWAPADLSAAPAPAPVETAAAPAPAPEAAPEEEAGTGDAELDALLADLEGDEAPAAEPQPAAEAAAEEAGASAVDDELDALLASLDSDTEEPAGDDDMDPELAALLEDL